MRTSHKQLWEQFCEFLDTIESQNTSTTQFIANLINWLISNKKHFPAASWSDYGLEQLTSVDSTNYCIEFTEESVQSTIARLYKYSPSSKDGITMNIRDILWDCMVHKTDIECPNCRDDNLRLMVNISREAILVCDLCCWGQDIDGKKYTDEFHLQIANKEDLKKFHQLK